MEINKASASVPTEEVPSNVVPIQEEPGYTKPAEQTLEPMPITASESIPATEPIQSKQQNVVALAPKSVSTESSSSVERPVERPRNARKSHRKVPTYGESSVIVRMKLRTQFEFDYGCDDLEKFEAMRKLMQWITCAVPLPRQSFPAGIEGLPVLRDVSTTQAELSSIREPNQSRLFPIYERPQQEELPEQQLQHVSLSVSGAEATERSISVPVVPPSPNLPYVSLGDASRALDTGLGNQTTFQDTSISLTIPQVVITDTSTDNGSMLHRETPVSEKPAIEQPIVSGQEAHVQPVVVSGQDQLSGNKPVEQTGDAVKITANNEVRGSGLLELACSSLLAHDYLGETPYSRYGYYFEKVCALSLPNSLLPILFCQNCFKKK